MPYCAAYGCKNKTGRMFGFPKGKRNKTRLKQWITMLGERFFDHVTARLCMQHFTPDQFDTPGRADGWRKLKPNAIPTEFAHRRMKLRKPPAKRYRSSSPPVSPSEADSPSSPETDQPLSLEADPPLSLEYDASLENEVAKVLVHMAKVN